MVEGVATRRKEFRDAGLPAKRAAALAWRRSGPYAVIVYGLSKKRDDSGLSAALQELGYAATDAPLLLERIEHIAAETVAFDLHQSEAVAIKQRLESLGAKVKIEELVRREVRAERPSIPEAVRHEVWRRDQGQCVDCGSRENLHFDHVIPWSRGGSNTARNLELRCEPCNLKKGAKV